MNVRSAHNLAIRPFMAPLRNRPPQGRPLLPVDESTPGGRLRALRIGARLDQQAMAEALGIERPLLSKYEHNYHHIPDPVIERASHRLGVTAAFIRYGDTESRLVQVVGRIGDGAHISPVAKKAGRYVEVPASWTDAIAISVEGQACYPIYEDGDVLVIRGEQRLVDEEILGKMCVVETQDGLGMVKRVRRGTAPGLYSLESPNAPTIEDVPLASARPVKLRLSH